MAGFCVDTDYNNRSLKSQFKQADRMKSTYYILLNSEDLNEGLITIRNSKTKEEDKIMIEYIIYYLDEHLIDQEMEELPMEEEFDSCAKDHCHNHHEE